ncbi:MAG: hypothetical protein K2K72_06630 [Duncaniella sp.]|nr:hypothetical protein [Duncaniella sp.]
MNQKLQKLFLPSAALMSLTLSGCMDDKYDLSDVDTTIGIQVSNLTIPVNLDAITLSNIFDLDEGSVIKDVDGSYAVLINGDFTSSEIKVNPVVLPAPAVTPISTQVSLLNGSPSINIPSLGMGELPFSYNITEASTDFSFSTNTVDKSIRAIDEVAVDWTITLRLSVNDHSGCFTSFNLSGVKLRLPRGLTTPGYENNDGVIALPDINPGRGVSTYSLDIPVSRINFKVMPASEYTFTPDPSGENGGTLSINSSIAIVEGKVTGTADTNASVPDILDFEIQPVMTDINIRTFTGLLDYSLDNFSVDDVVLNDLPDLLTDPSTNISLANPQLYLSVNNPMASYSVKAYSGLSLTPFRNGEAGTPATLNPGQTIEIGFDKGITGPYKFCLSPAAPSTFFKGDVDGNAVDYSGALHVGYSALSNVLAGEGLPESIAVDFTKARIGSLDGPARVTDFVLGEPLEDVKGNYTFYAPLQFNDGSKIGYDDTTDGWLDDTLEKLTISGVRLRANVSNGLPFDVTLTGYPVTLEGKQCVDPATGKPVSFNEITIPAGRTAPIDLECKGTVINLDGIRYIASGTVTDASVTLQPESPLKLTDIRVTVDGSYRDEL